MGGGADCVGHVDVVWLALCATAGVKVWLYCDATAFGELQAPVGGRSFPTMCELVHGATTCAESPLGAIRSA